VNGNSACMPLVPKYSLLCFGDSNTWGFVPGTGERYRADVRWPGVLREALGADYWVIEEGLNGRTTIWDDPAGVGRNGQTYLPPCLQTHRPLDAVILFLGLNDLKPKFGATAEAIADGACTQIGLIRQSGAGIGGGSPRILVISPPRIGRLTGYADQFDGAQANSARLAACLAAVARQHGCEFLDISEVISASDIDGIHLDADAHRTLGMAVADQIQSMRG
jgi:lysophospholipase L1-like esterase